MFRHFDISMFRDFDTSRLRDLIERRHHEVAFMHQRMRNLQVWLVNRQVVIEQDVDVDWAVGIFSFWLFAIGYWLFSPTLMSASHVAFNLLCQQEHLAWCLGRFAEDDGIQELVLRFKTPRFRLDKRRLAGDVPHSVVDQADGSFQVLSAIAQIRAQS